MLLYSLLHLTGYDLPLEELKRFRQWESKTPGHPERGATPGVEVCHGSAGAGLRQRAWGWRSRKRWLAAHLQQTGTHDCRSPHLRDLLAMAI